MVLREESSGGIVLISSLAKFRILLQINLLRGIVMPIPQRRESQRVFYRFPVSSKVLSPLAMAILISQGVYNKITYLIREVS